MSRSACGAAERAVSWHLLSDPKLSRAAVVCLSAKPAAAQYIGNMTPQRGCPRDPFICDES